MRRVLCTVVLINVLGSLVLSTAGAATIDSIGVGGFSGAEAIVTFNGVGDPVTTVASVQFARVGSSNPVRRIFDPASRPVGPAGTESVHNDGLFDGAPIEITFPGPARRVGFENRANIADNSPPIVVEFFVGSTSIGTGEIQGYPYVSSPAP